MGLTPVYIFPEFAKGELDPNILMRRLDAYGAAYTRLSSGGRLMVLIGLDSKKMDLMTLEVYEHIKIIHVSSSTKNFIKFAFLSYRKMKKAQVCPTILIAGDLYFAFLTTLLLKISSFKRLLPIQISIHGFYIENLEMGRRRLWKVLSMYLVTTYKIATSIRAVSPEIKENLVSKYRVKSSKIFVSPVPIDLGNPCQSNLRTIDVLFVGRFHEERGIKQLEDIFELSRNKGLNLKPVVVGSGPLLTEFKKNMSKLWPNCRFEGFLNHADLNQLFCTSRILLSTAPTEGYGLTIREALTQGCILLARRNEVTSALAANFPNLVFLFDSIEEATEYLQTLSKMKVNHLDSQAFRSHVQLTNKESLDQLSTSWLSQT